MFALFVLSACPVDQEFTPSTKDKGDTDLFPDIEIEPDALVFEMADPGSETEQIITIENRGDLDLHVTNLVLSGTTAFSVGTEETAATIAPGARISVPIHFTPVNPEDFASLVVTSDDPDSGQLTVPLSGSGKIPQLYVSPNPYNFGSVLLECAREQPITLANIGNGTLIVDQAVTTAEGFTLSDEGLPAYLGPDESIALPLRFEPPAVLDYGGELWITSNSLVSTTTLAVSGKGTTESGVADEFWQGDGPWDRTDIFFYVDQSGSMADDQDNMIANFSGFVEQLERLDLDWQIIISTRDTGCSNTGILTPDTPNLETAFLEGVRGAGGRYTEAGLTVAAGAINRSVPGECNEGFLREDSKTSVVLVSDEPDQSPGSYAGYVAQIQSVAPTAAITAIVGDVPNGCATADPGYGYYEAAIATHGAFLSICEADWSTYFDAIAVLSSTGQTDRFGLSSPPDPATLQVSVDNTVLATGWSYDEAGQAVVFDSASVPAPGAYILVEYDLLADCAD
jgi:hypothetical protein